MENTLQELDIHIKRLRPDFYDSLQDPLEEKDIQALEEQYKIRIAEDLKKLYRWKNGQESSSYEVFVNNSMLMTLENALNTAQELTAMIGTDFDIENWWNRHWIPIFHNGGGSYICYDFEGTFTGNKGQIIEFWNRDPDRNVIASNLESFLKQLNDYYTRLSEDDADEFFTVEGQNGFPLRFYVK
ncbi:SMI1/KNR4 family protein [Chryseobacterium sp.]|uniref:SMI1/KNR4 family protein n=1 Tax=Chryseobacterium sp. TaxID=1871047 RepID=UPI001B19D78C|nr:SMI1/KNR4 family protein [Chryseobacterium sp.]MBO9691027.1 SMI1/KNR4 family protein [Chryseobacterium sp.]